MLSIYGYNLNIIPVRKLVDTLYLPIYNTNNNYPFSINPIGLGKYYGWQIDKNERFLLNNFIITHNSRLRGGKDYASPRYIWTMFDDLTTIIFNSNDNPILNQQYEDNMLIEPEFYAPIIPMILINGTEGIGTGFSTKIPPYNPLEIINNLKNIINNKPFEEMNPWWQGFIGTVKKISNYNYEILGNWKIKDNTLIINELPIGEWTSNYKEFLEKLLDENKNKSKNDTKIKKKRKRKFIFKL